MNHIEKLTINSIRMLSVEAIQKANSGHPGMALGAAHIAYTLYADAMNYNPANPAFDNRDRFILSAGHGSALLYSALHIFGFGVLKEDLTAFRQLGSITPGHPELGHTPGVETSTGPLGQGYANAVGMAAAESILAAKFNRPGFSVVDHYTYCLAGDGCMMEGLSYEAGSLAGTWGLNKLIVIYDSNDISIEGNTDIAFRENVALRHEAQGWQVLRVDDMHDLVALREAIEKAKASVDKPTLIVAKTIIGYGSPNEGSEDTHGSPLGANMAGLREKLNWTLPSFEIPDEVKSNAIGIAAKGATIEKKWRKLFADYKKEFPAEADEYAKWMSEAYLKQDFAGMDDLWACADKPDATRNTGAVLLKKLTDLIPNLLGGSADLGPSNKTYLKGRGDYSKENRNGFNFRFGVREHAMASICNGIYLHGGLLPYCSTFFVFSDYMRGAIRMSALMDIPVMYILTHDSIGVGEDGPTHQPVEHLAALRVIPNLNVYRPADYRETAACYINAVTLGSPSALALTRQNLPQLEGSGKGALKGGYVLSDCAGKPDVILMGSGSEVQLLVSAKATLAERGISVRVVSMPCMEIFDAQAKKYRNSVLLPAVKNRVAIEAGSAIPWYKYASEVISIDDFGVSAPAERLFELYGITAERVAERVLEKVKK